MLDSVNSKIVENNKINVQDKKASINAQIKDEQENFSKLIKNKALEVQKQNHKEDGVEHSAKIIEKAKEENKKIKTSALEESFALENLKQKDVENNPVFSKKDSPTMETRNTVDTVSEKKLVDIQELAKQKDLKPEKITIQKEQQSKQQTTEIGTQDLLNQKIKTQAKKIQNVKIDEPLTQALKEVSTKDAMERKKLNQFNKIEYKLEGKGEKIAVIERGKKPPKNIVEPRIREEKKEAEFKKVFDRFGIKDENKNMTSNLKQESLSLDDEKKKILM